MWRDLLRAIAVVFLTLACMAVVIPATLFAYLWWADTRRPQIIADLPEPYEASRAEFNRRINELIAHGTDLAGAKQKLRAAGFEVGDRSAFYVHPSIVCSDHYVVVWTVAERGLIDSMNGSVSPVCL